MGASLYNKIPVGHRAGFFGMTRAQIAAGFVGVVGLAAVLVVLIK